QLPARLAATPRGQVLVPVGAGGVGEVDVGEPRTQRVGHRQRVLPRDAGVRQVEGHVLVAEGHRVPVGQVGVALLGAAAVLGAGLPREHVLHRDPHLGRGLAPRDALDEAGGVLALPAERGWTTTTSAPTASASSTERSILPHASVPHTRWVSRSVGEWIARTGTP